MARRSRLVSITSAAEFGESVHRFVHCAVGGQGRFDLRMLLDQVSEAQARGECGLRWPRAERGGFSDGACSDSHVQ